MSNISRFLNEILSARYGKDVRQSIHDAIQEIDSVADTAQNSASSMAQEATAKAESAANSAALAQSYAKGGTGVRTGENTDNAKYYYEQTKNASVQQLASKIDANTAAISNANTNIGKNTASIKKNTDAITEIEAVLGYSTDTIVGLQVDYKNKSFKRLAGAIGLNQGADFDTYTMFGGRKRCNVADDGSITAWYGDTTYKEDGSNGQVMVYQPKFYYKVCPLEVEPIDTGIGYHLRKANYYVSELPHDGFKLHPAFYDASGKEIDYYLDSAFEGSIYDASASAYLMNDEQVMNTGEDKFCSIAGAKPASGLSQNLTRPNVEALAQNRGTEWHGDLIKFASARQLLMIIELGTMNTQTGIGDGVTGITDNSSYNCSSLTGSTSALGNTSGKATQTINTKGDTQTTETANNKVAVSWRGTENPWGNIWKFVYGVNIWGNGEMNGGEPYICNDFNFAESKNSDNYEAAGFTATNANGYISAMGYSEKYDWLFIASECTGNSSLPVGDYQYVTSNLNGYRIARLGGGWDIGGSAGGFYWSLVSGVGSRFRNVGGRLVLIPTKGSAVYKATIKVWKQKMTA